MKETAIDLDAYTNILGHVVVLACNSLDNGFACNFSSVFCLSETSYTCIM